MRTMTYFDRATGSVDLPQGPRGGQLRAKVVQVIIKEDLKAVSAAGGHRRSSAPPVCAAQTHLIADQRQLPVRHDGNSHVGQQISQSSVCTRYDVGYQPDRARKGRLCARGAKEQDDEAHHWKHDLLTRHLRNARQHTSLPSAWCHLETPRVYNAFMLRPQADQVLTICSICCHGNHTNRDHIRVVLSCIDL